MSTAPSLPELQRAFTRWVIGETEASLPDWISDNGLTSNARLTIYRNAVFSNLTAALHTAYPAIFKLTGEEFFETAATRYIRTWPSSSGNLQDYGAAFPEFLALLPEAAGLPYLADVARLEWARQQAYLAADAEPLDPSALIAVPEYQQTALRLALHPSLRLIASPHAILDIWEFCQQENPGKLTLGQAGQCVLVWRTHERVSMQALVSGQQVFMASLLEGQSLAIARQHAVRAESGFDLSGCLRWLFTAPLVTGYSLA